MPYGCVNGFKFCSVYLDLGEFQFTRVRKNIRFFHHLVYFFQENISFRSAYDKFETFHHNCRKIRMVLYSKYKAIPRGSPKPLTTTLMFVPSKLEQ